MARWATVISTAVVLALTACGGSGDDPILVAPSSTVAPDTSIGPSATSGPAPPTETVELTVVGGVPAEAPGLLLATTEGVARWSVAEGRTLMVEVDDEVRHVVDDGRGGAVGLTVDEQLLASVRWWPADGDELLLRSQGGLALHDATVRNGEPAVVITYSPIDSAETAQVLDILDLATTSSRTVRQVGDASSGAVSAAASDTGFAVTQVDGPCASVITFDDTGETVDDRTLPAVKCRDESPAYGSIGFSDDGSRLVVSTSNEDGGAALLASARDADEIAEHPLPDGIEAVTAIDVQAQYVVLSTASSTHLVDLDRLTIVDLGIESRSVQILSPP